MRDAHTATCSSCGTGYPLIDCGNTAIPWLFPRPDAARLEWNARYRGFLQGNANDHNRLNRALANERLSVAGRQRLTNLLAARRGHRSQLAELLAPIPLDGEDLVPATTHALHAKLPRNQGLCSYVSNVFRDWAWDNGENAAALDAVEAVLGDDLNQVTGSILTLGGGGCRLPYDLHRRYRPRLSVALDFNPLLLLIACRVIQGQTIPLYEFPIAPFDGEANAVLQHCRAPAPLSADVNGEFRFVFGDATNPPFAPGSFDAVVTPWLIDIISEDLGDFIPTVNRLLPEGGLWVNTGSLAFFREDPCQCYSESETLALVERNGFEIVAVDRRTVPYLCSPHSAHGRTERLMSFTAKKHRNVAPNRRASRMPEWILDPTQPVPSTTDSVLASSSHLLLAQVLAAVDGKRSITAISKLVAREYDLTEQECMHAVQRILIDRWEDESTPIPE